MIAESRARPAGRGRAVLAGADRRPGPAEDLLVLVFSCRKPRHRRLREAIRGTWAPRLARLGGSLLFVVGEEGGRPRLEGDVLVVDARDNYEHLVLKVLAAYEQVGRRWPGRFRWIFKVDDDCWVHPGRLCARPFRRHPYSGRVLRVPPDTTWHVGKCEDPAYEEPYTRPYLCEMATGIGYFFDARLLEPLAAEVPRVRDELARKLYDFEDKRVAETLYRHGVPVAPLEGYGAVFLDRHGRFAPSWRVDPAAPHRFADFEVITECEPEDLWRIARVVGPGGRAAARRAAAYGVDETPRLRARA